MRIIATISCLLLVLSLHAQKSCSVDSLSADDQNKLKVFWKELKTSLKTKDREKLATLIHFPFSCLGCLNDSLHKEDEVSLNRNEYDMMDFSIFFEGMLLDYLNRNSFPENFPSGGADSNEKRKRCSFDFEYFRTKGSERTGPQRQDFITIEKIKGKFKIVSVWSIP